MKPSEFRKFYLTFTELYGAIHSDDAYAIMKRFFPKLLKKEMYADMKSRVGKMTRDYMIRPTTERKYVICSEWHNDEDLNEIFAQHGDLPFYVSDDLEEYWKIGKEGVPHPPAAEELIDYLTENCGDEPGIAGLKVAVISYVIRNTYYTEIPDKILQYISTWDPPLTDFNKIKTVLDLVLEITKTLRLPAYCGYTLRELDVLDKDSAEENVPEIANTLQDLLLEEDVDEEELIRQLKEDHSLPEYAKESLIKALEEIAEAKKDLPKA